jgi:predicted NUDIX family NTP pyrophosphohydrolase
MPGSPPRSAGLLLFRLREGRPEVLIGHMGGPFWAKKDERAWSIPKGEYGDDEEPLAAARREFEEELGGPPPGGEALALGEARQSNGKVVTAWALQGDFDASEIQSNSFAMEWPPRSGQTREFPEIDRAEWVDLPTARRKLVKGQVALVDELERQIGAN